MLAVLLHGSLGFCVILGSNYAARLSLKWSIICQPGH